MPNFLGELEPWMGAMLCEMLCEMLCVMLCVCV